MTNKFKNYKASKNIKFLGEQIEILKLSAASVIEVQNKAKEAEETKSDRDNINLMIMVIHLGAPELAELTEEELLELPLESLSDLTREIMAFSGMGK